MNIQSPRPRRRPDRNERTRRRGPRLGERASLSLSLYEAEPEGELLAQFVRTNNNELFRQCCFVCMVFSRLAILRIEGCLNSTL